jgi:hypothetical protein
VIVAVTTLAGCFAPGTGDDNPAAPDPLLLNISVHAEGYQDEDDETAQGQAIFEQHVAALTALADAADGGDGVGPGEARITFELSPIFVRATELWGSDFVPEMDARGHGIGVHADIGGTGHVDRAAFVAELADQREAIEAQGVDVVHVSGICSPSEWVEAAIDAGFAATTGMVEYCLSSIPAYPLTCGDTAEECHGPAVTDWEHKLHPWRTSTSSDWLTADSEGALLLVAGESGSGVSCLGEAAAGRSCAGVTDQSDVGELEAIIEEYLAARETGRLNVLTFSWSIGRPPTAGFAAELFGAVAPYVEDGDVEWSTLEEVVARS